MDCLRGSRVAVITVLVLVFLPLLVEMKRGHLKYMTNAIPQKPHTHDIGSHIRDIGSVSEADSQSEEEDTITQYTEDQPTKRLGKRARCQLVVKKHLRMYKDTVDVLSAKMSALRKEVKRSRRQNRRLHAVMLWLHKETFNATSNDRSTRVNARQRMQDSTVSAADSASAVEESRESAAGPYSSEEYSGESVTDSFSAVEYSGESVTDSSPAMDYSGELVTEPFVKTEDENFGTKVEADLMLTSQKERASDEPTDSKKTHYHIDCHHVENRSSSSPSAAAIELIHPHQDELRGYYVPCTLLAGKGWVTIQRRYSGRVNFDRLWSDYREGFGEFADEFWLGNEKIHQITSQGQYQLMVTIEDTSKQHRWALYKSFSILSNSTGYQLSISDYDPGSTLPDGLTAPWHSTDGFPFVTKDMNKFDHCGSNHYFRYLGGWWFNECPGTSLNGRVPRRYEGVDDSDSDLYEANELFGFAHLGMNWHGVEDVTLTGSMMMIARVD